MNVVISHDRHLNEMVDLINANFGKAVTISLTAVAKQNTGEDNDCVGFLNLIQVKKLNSSAKLYSAMINKGLIVLSKFFTLCLNLAVKIKTIIVSRERVTCIDSHSFFRLFSLQIHFTSLFILSHF